MDHRTLESDELISICTRTGETGAWEEFIRRFNPLIARVVVRTARVWGQRMPSVLDDLMQETYLKLCSDDCRLLRTFESRGPDAIYGYLKVVTANVVHDHFKGARAAKRGAGEIAEDIETAEVGAAAPSQPSASNQASMERAILLQEIDRHLARSIPAEDLPRSQLIFWLYYRSGLSASAIASLPNIGLTTKGVESALLRLTRVVRTALTEPGNQRKEKQQDSLQDPKGYRRAESF
jgi:RNA polymerase sigma-70 factor (ECF subfamily)